VTLIVNLFVTVMLGYFLSFVVRRLLREFKTGSTHWTVFSYWMGTIVLSLGPMLLLSVMTIPVAFSESGSSEYLPVLVCGVLPGVCVLGVLMFIVALGPGGTLGLIAGAVIRKFMRTNRIRVLGCGAHEQLDQAGSAPISIRGAESLSMIMTSVVGWIAFLLVLGVVRSCMSQNVIPSSFRSSERGTEFMSAARCQARAEVRIEKSTSHADDLSPVTI
jgi:hypothetical protein